MIKYTIENKEGIHNVSNYFDINEDIALIRIINKSLILKEELSSPTLIITNFSINGVNFLYKQPLSPYGHCSTVFDLPPISELLKNTNDIKIEIKENSKIEVNIFFSKKIGKLNNFENFSAPTINKTT
jgi:hypothetical protein